MRYFIINTKNYVEAIDGKLDRLASIVSSSSKTTNSKGGGAIGIYLAVPAFYLYYLSIKFPSLKLLAQHLDTEPTGSTTGFLIPGIAKHSGAIGSLVNHSEHRLDEQKISTTVQKLRELHMISVVCARDNEEVGKLAALNPDFIAVEPPELIGSGIAVSEARPEVISDSKAILEKSKNAGSKTKLLCGAGIVNEIDARRSIELGAEGILVASGVIKANNWKGKVAELVRGISGAKRGSRKQ